MDLTPQEINAFIADRFPAAAHNRCEALGDGWALARWSFDDSQDRPGGLISGPVQFGLADAALWYASFTVWGLKPMAVTADLSIRFLRPAAGGDLLARAEILKRGRSGLVGDIRLWIDGAAERPVSVASGTYVDATPT